PEVRTILSVPGVKVVTRTDWQPAHRPKRQVNRSSTVATESEERHVGRRPLGPIIASAVNRSRPPHPGTTLEDPTAVVVGSPAPRFERDPRPAPVRLPDPATGSI